MWHGVPGIHHEVHDHLCKLGGVGPDIAQSLSRRDHQLDVLANQAPQHVLHARDHRIHVQDDGVLYLLSTEGQQLARQRYGPLSGMQDLAQIRAQRVPIARLRQRELGRAVDDGQQVVEIVGDAPRELTHALHVHTAVLDVAAPEDLILVTSFGSGAASDSFVLKATALLPERRGRARTVRSMPDHPTRYLTYGQYASYREKIILNDSRVTSPKCSPPRRTRSWRRTTGSRSRDCTR